MPRKARTKRREAPNRTAPTLVTPFVGLGDVLALVDFEIWRISGKRSLYRALLQSVFAVFAACARVRPATAVLFLLADYEAGGLATKSRRGDHPYPVVLLPAAVAVIEAYLKERRRLGIRGELLLVDEEGAPLNHTRIYDEFARFSERCGHAGGRVIDRLIEFHDLQLEKDRKRRVPDPAACVALRRGRRGDLDNDHAWTDIRAAAADRERLLRVLDRNHDLGGDDVGRSIGGHGRAKASKAARLFLPPKVVLKLSPAVHSDRVCARLLGQDWTEMKSAQRMKIVREDLPHLVGLLDAGLIKRSDLRHLLHCSIATVRYHELRYRRSLEADDERRERERLEAKWREKAPALFLARPGSETFPAFHARIAAIGAADRYPFGRAMLSATLRFADVLPDQIARRRNNRMSG